MNLDAQPPPLYPNDSPAIRRHPVSVIVCTYTDARLAILTEALEAVSEQLDPADQILLVADNNVILYQKLQPLFPKVSVLLNDQPGGLSAARNRGVQEATNEIVLFLDDDAVPQAGWIDHLTAPFSHGKVAGTGGWVEPRWQTPPPSWWPDTFNWVVGCSYRGLPTTNTPIRNPIGASMAFRRSLILSSGYFRTDIGRVGGRPMGCEETELSIRITRDNPSAQILHAPAAVVHHYVPTQRCTPKYFTRRCFAEGRSKALLSSSVSRSTSLAAEFRHVRTMLIPGLVPARHHGTSRPLAVAAATAAGLAIVTTGYIVQTVRQLIKVRGS
jgi:GT2 family glycosyltransferase